MHEILFIGVNISDNRLNKDHAKVENILNWLTLTNVKQVQRFVRYMDFYFWFIQAFSKLVKLLLMLTKKNILLVWTESCKKLFQSLKKLVAQTSIFKYFNIKHQSSHETNLSYLVIGRILSQYNDGESSIWWRSISRVSFLLNVIIIFMIRNSLLLLDISNIGILNLGILS